MYYGCTRILDIMNTTTISSLVQIFLTEQEIASKGILGALGHIFPTVPQAPLLEDEDSAFLWLYIIVGRSIACRDPRRPSFDIVIAEIYLESDAGFAPILKL